MSSRLPTLALAANRHIGLKALELLLDAGLRPSLLIVPDGACAEFTSDMRSLLAGSPCLTEAAFSDPGSFSMLRDLGLDYLLSVHFPHRIPGSIVTLPSIGTLNLHPSYLPFNRGWHTPSWAIIDRTPYGATLHWVDEGLDTGDIALQKKVEVLPHHTAHTLYQDVLKAEEELLEEAIPLMLSSSLPRIPQDQGKGTSHKKKDLCNIQSVDLSSSFVGRDLIDRLRALSTSDWNEAAQIDVDGRKYRIQVTLRPLEES